MSLLEQIPKPTSRSPVAVRIIIEYITDLPTIRYDGEKERYEYPLKCGPIALGSGKTKNTQEDS